jgi:hypothetical protein
MVPPMTMTDAAGPTVPMAAALVAELWRTCSPHAAAVDRELAESPAGLCARLAAVAGRAESLPVNAATSERAALSLLVATARAIHRYLEQHPDEARPVSDAAPHAPDAGGRTPWVERLRLARMERWLATRADADPVAGPAADLCLWVVEHLEARAR